MVDKKYCMSSFLAFRYIEDNEKDFYPYIHHKNLNPIPNGERIPVHTAEDINYEIQKEFDAISNKKIGIMLSGGMDSANLATYMKGCDAYTFRFLEGKFQRDELLRAEKFAELNNLKLHYVDINWDIVEKNIDEVMKAKAAPVHSIEPQILQAALQAKRDGIEIMIIGESSDLIFGGMDQLLEKEWTFNAFVKRYIFTNPEDVLVEPVSMRYLFERYRKDDNRIDYLRFMDDIFATESSSSYMNAFAVAEMPYLDPYAKLIMADKLDLFRIRHGESKYLIRSLFAMRYPDILIPDKIPMPRPVDIYFADWKGPKRSEFRKDIDLSQLTGNQKWQIWCLERFLNMMEKI